MSIQAVAWALDQELPARPKLVLVSIANHADHVSGYCWLKAETIAFEAACTKRSIYNFVGSLVRNGFLRKQLRKGEDGKQRATDYWIVFTREQKPWHPGARPDANEPDEEPIETESETQDIVEPGEPGERRSSGEDEQPGERHDTRQPVDKHVYSPGPVESGFRREKIEEPSKSNPKKDARASGSYVPRHYHPPPPEPEQPQGAVVADKEAKQIFVFHGSRAWHAWSNYKLRTTGARWTLTSRHTVEGRRGWFFPSLFPPDLPASASATGGPPRLATEEDLDEFGKTG